MSELHAFLFTDIEGSTRLWGDHPESMPAALELHDAALATAVADAAGDLFKHTGDGIVAHFDNATAAIRGAIGIQRELQRVRWPETGPLRVRSGIHVGEAIQRDDDWFGTSLNTAARLMGAGHGGQILVSGTAWALAPASDGWEGIDLGIHRLRDLAEPMQVWQITAELLERDFAPLRTLDAYTSNLPRNLASFVGRDRVVEEVQERVISHPLVTLTGIGGIGKTRTSQQVGATVLPRFDGGVWFIDLAATRRPDEVGAAVGRVLRVQPRSTESMNTTIADAIRDTQMLIILDNCEQVIPAAADLAETIGNVAPKVRVLATSREALGVTGEQVVPLPGLDGDAALSLFKERAAAAGARIATHTDDATIVELCERVDGLPLAIELSAARTRSMSPSEILTRIDERFRMLKGSAQRPDRHRTLHGMVEWSYHLLEDDERELFTRLAVFAGTFELATIETVCADDDLDEFDISLLLDQLVGKSMLSVAVDFEPTRYRMLETLRQYAGSKLDEAPARDGVVDRHTRFYIRRARTLGSALQYDEGTSGKAALVSDIDNINAAIDRLGRLGRHDEKVRAINSISIFLQTLGAQTARLRYDDLVNERESLSPDVQFDLLLEAASVNSEHGFVTRSAQLLDWAHDLHVEHDIPLNALYHFAVATAAEFDGRTEDVIRAYEVGSPIAEREGNPFVRIALHNRVVSSIAETDIDAAQKIVDQATAEAEELGIGILVASSKMLTGVLHVLRGDTEAADVAIADAIATNDGLVYQVDLVSLAALAVNHYLAELPDALELAQDAVRAESEFDVMPTMRSTAATAVALCWLREGRLDDAARALGWIDGFHARVGFGGIAWATRLRENLRDQLRATLEAPVYDEYIGEGQALTDAQAERLLLSN